MTRPPGRPTGGHVRGRGRSVSSTRWLQRQLDDPYVAEAKRRGYRSRAAFKLAEIDDRLHLLRPGLRVLDLGAAPGGWTQVAVERGARVLAVDLQPMASIPGAEILQADLRVPETLAAIEAALGGKADLVLSDMAPATIGHHGTDHLRIVALAEAAAEVAGLVLKPGGDFVTKLFQGGAQGELLLALKRQFTSIKPLKPPASRKDSAELYLVARSFRPEASE